MTYADFKYSPPPKWEMLLARLLGKRVVGVDFGRGETTITTYHWRGKVYVVDEKSS